MKLAQAVQAVLGKGGITDASSATLQGTNAHVIMCHTEGSDSTATAVKDVLWQRRRLWFAPSPHLLLQRALVAARGIVQLATLLSRTQLAYLWDHQVAFCTHLTSKQSEHIQALSVRSNMLLAVQPCIGMVEWCPPA